MNQSNRELSLVSELHRSLNGKRSCVASMQYLTRNDLADIVVVPAKGRFRNVPHVINVQLFSSRHLPMPAFLAMDNAYDQLIIANTHGLRFGVVTNATLTPIHRKVLAGRDWVIFEQVTTERSVHARISSWLGVE